MEKNNTEEIKKNTLYRDFKHYEYMCKCVLDALNKYPLGTSLATISMNIGQPVDITSETLTRLIWDRRVVINTEGVYRSV